jgi:hypothetical protein
MDNTQQPITPLEPIPSPLSHVPPLTSPLLPVQPDPVLFTPAALPLVSSQPLNQTAVTPITAEPTIIVPTTTNLQQSKPVESQPMYNSQTAEIQNFIDASTTTPIKTADVVLPNVEQLFRSVPIINNIDPITPQATITNSFQENYPQPDDLIKRKSYRKVIVGGSALILAIIATSAILISSKSVELSKRYTLSNKGVNYSFVYYSDAIQGINILTGNKQLTGYLKSPTSAAFSSYPYPGNCLGLGSKVKTIGSLVIKGIKILSVVMIMIKQLFSMTKIRNTYLRFTQ